tara:strand:- start:18919 stop:19500 length:582 start_codon:yes stop_codon:yes gene_type:complete
MKTVVACVLSAAILIALSGAASAHSFNVVMISGPTVATDQLQSAIDGFLVASAENDGHSNETADGHLGGLDVFTAVLPAAQVSKISGLVGQTSDEYDFAIVLGDGPSFLNESSVGPTTIILRPGVLPDPTERVRFIQTYRARFKTTPNDTAAQGYNAARRIDQAIRIQGAAAQSDDLRAALAATAGGISWQDQ